MTADRRTAAGAARSVIALREANARRSDAAGRSNREVAAAVISGWQADWPQAWRQIARALLDNPGLTWRQLAASIGMTRSQATSHFRRMRIEVTGQ